MVERPPLHAAHGRESEPGWGRPSHTPEPGRLGDEGERSTERFRLTAAESLRGAVSTDPFKQNQAQPWNTASLRGRAVEAPPGEVQPTPQNDWQG